MLTERAAARFRKKVVAGDNGCLIWTGSKTKRAESGNAHGRFMIRSYVVGLAHRVAWENERGPIPDGMVIDHYLRNDPATRDNCSSLCVNPDHMRLVTQVENIRSSAAAREAGIRTGSAKRRCDLPPGVTYSHGGRSLRAKIVHHGRSINLGSRTPDTDVHRSELHALYLSARAQLDGENG